MHERPKLLIRPVKNCGLMNGLDEANEEEDDELLSNLIKQRRNA